MKKLSLRQKAGRANGLSHSCNKCPFLFNGISMEICRICRESFIEGYTKGYKQANLERKNHNERKN